MQTNKKRNTKMNRKRTKRSRSVAKKFCGKGPALAVAAVARASLRYAPQIISFGKKHGKKILKKYGPAVTNQMRSDVIKNNMRNNDKY